MARDTGHEIHLGDYESIHRALLENLQEGIWWIADDGRTRYVNRRLADLLGCPAPQMIGRHVTDFSSFGETILDRPVHEEVRLRRCDGSLVDVRVAGGPLFSGDGISGALASVVDISEQRNATQQYELLVKAVTQAAESVVITDAEASIRYVNPAFTQITGYTQEELIGRNPRILQSGEHGADFYRDMWTTLTAGDDWKGVFRNRTKDGSIYAEEGSITPLVLADGTITHYIGVRRDVTEELELQRQLETSQRLQAIGTLAGGVAHDFNNVLMAILGYASIASAEAGPDTTVAPHLDHITQAARRARDLADKLLTFSRGSEGADEPTSLAEPILEAVRMMHATVPANVEILCAVSDDLPSVQLGDTQITQVVMNLVLNGAAAIEPGEPGHIVIRAVAEGALVVLEVRDNGCGMDDVTASRVFEPFFSTRAVGEGSGMGLPVVHGIVSGAGGTMDVASTPGEGTTFTIELPACPDVSAKPAADAERPERTGGDGTLVLIVDDEEPLVELLCHAFRRDGFDAEGFTDPAAAIARLDASPESVGAVITDVTMREMRGDRLARAMLARRPDLPVIGYTGFSNEVDEDAARAAGMRRLLRKPLDLSDLTRAVHEEIHSEEPHE